VWISRHRSPLLPGMHQYFRKKTHDTTQIRHRGTHIMTVCSTGTMQRILVCIAVFLVLITENEAGHDEPQCIPILYDVWGRDPSKRTAVTKSFNTGLNVDDVLSLPGATAFAVSGRGQTTSSTNLRFFVTSWWNMCIAKMWRWLDRTRRWILSVRRREIQRQCREPRLYGLRSRNVFQRDRSYVE